MKVAEFYQRRSPVFSFEFFLPSDDNAKEAFFKTLSEIKSLGPHFVSLTYGAGGSARDKTIETAGTLKNHFGFETVMHLTSIAHTKDEIDRIIERVRLLGIENIMALRGDIPKDQSPPASGKCFQAPSETGTCCADQRWGGDFPFACDLVAHLRKNGNWCLGVAGYPEGHPECPSKEEDLRHLKEKIAAGADYVITQLFFDNKDYFDFVRRARAAGINQPIVPGIMPVTNFKQIQKFSSLCGVKIPRDLLGRLSQMQNDPEAIATLGIDHAARQCQELLEQGAPGIHFFTLKLR
ncbi:MAG: methylenetetrahydrofolate reductase [Elusimicrobia bacterium]|nr:methylenetetrahydrofolate reductase [Elusimicrobiota bacterium]